MRKRILLAIGATLLAMLALLTAASVLIQRRTFADLEESYVLRNVWRARADLDAQVLDIASRVADYAFWADMDGFARRPTPEFVEENFEAWAQANIGVNVSIVVVAQGRRLAVVETGEAARENGLGTLLADWLDAHPGFGRLTARNLQPQGLVVLDGRMLLVAARPIYNPTDDRPPSGTIAMARLIDTTVINAIGMRLALTVDLQPIGDSPLPAAARRAAERLEGDGAPAVEIDRSNRLTAIAWTILDDALGTPAALMRLDAPRDIWRAGMRTLLYTLAWLLFVGAGFTVAVLVALERIVLSRITRLGAEVARISTGGDPGRRLDIPGRDQIAYLGAAINGMLDSVARSTEDLRASERRTEAFLDAVPDVIFRVARDGTIKDARSPARLPLLEAAGDLVGRDSEQILSLFSFLSPELFGRSMAATEAALESGAPQVLEFSVDVEGGRRWYQERFVASGTEEVIVLVRDVTALKTAEEARRQEILLKEIHHRVKNNLQVISGMLALQARAAGDERTHALLTESRDRVRSMAMIHEKLYEAGSARGIGFAAYVRDLATHLRHSWAGSSESVRVVVDVEEDALDLDLSVPCGLVITELLSNALRHAFPGGRAGTVTVSMRREGAEHVLSVRDDGVGIPPGIDPGAPATLGLRIVQMLVAQVRGTLEVLPGPGASFVVRLPAA